MNHRDSNLRLLQPLGFRVAPGLPVERQDGATQLRPSTEILGRALALRAVCFWVAATEEMVPSATIAARAYSDDVKPYLTHADEGILTLPRADAHEQHIGTIGWRLENIWPLAWILGFDPKPALQGMADDSIISKVMTFLPRDSQTAASFLKDSRIRPLSEVDALEDLFYCAHNAVRSAQLGGDAVPKDFDPISDGGVVHERRHALTWALSPGVAWDDTDLST
jgi:hypothetical protein